ncbi:glyoxalase [Rubrivivax gelatinosus]|uniref:Glyoxalase n=1 Tax=Rubrivivax gelatinosus TaxID=28068 RepID=A0ABS1DTF0_RUBGE|nr:VOC family protein [Rubrivivax gelatinosus]MBK1613707.1 glyoxalase [Rubrivivax gelatinosus]MBK1712934.1 glyoxalase [Rubrivivax gelatinosus]
MDVFKTHGAFSWNELLTGDPERAAGFYAGLFGWSVEAQEIAGGTYRVVKTADGTAVGGIMGIPPDSPPGMPPHWGSYVTVDSVDDAIAKAEALGGTVIVPPMDIPGVGRMAVLRDPTGAAVNVMSYEPM